MRIKLIILTILYLLFGIRSVFAVTVTISNTPSTVSDQPFSFDVSITGASSATNYLRADFFQPSTTSYFGYTFNGSGWYNGSDYTQYLPVSITSSGYTGTIQAKIDTSATKFTGNGTYNLRLRRYTQSGNYTASESNIISVNVNLTSSTPTSTPTPTPSTSSTSSLSNSSSSSFTISNTPSKINSDQSFNVSISLSSPDNPNTVFYLKGAFRHPDKPNNYFGFTKINETWIKNSATYTSQYKINTDSTGNWSGTLEVKPDADDSGYTGTDDYIFKVGRYTSSGSGPTWSNESTVKIIATSTQNTVSETSSKTPGKTSNSPANSNPSSQVAKTNIANSVPTKSSGNIKYLIASVAGAAASESASPSATAEVKNEGRNFIPWIGGVLILAGISSLLYIYLQNHETILNKFRKRN